MTYFSPGDVLVNSLVLSAQRGSVNLMPLLGSMVIYEDITLPGINLEIVILEDVNFMDFLPLVGEEMLTVDYNSPGLGSFQHTFYITSMQNANPTTNLKTKAYKLVGVAPEVLKHKTTLVNKAYNTQNSAMVQDIFKTFLGSSRPLIVEQTKGIQEYTVTNERPFMAIKNILARSVSDTHESSSYVFFENQHGFNFRTLEDLCSQSSRGNYTNYEVVNDSVFKNNFRNILGYTIPDGFKVAEKLGLGAVTSTVKKYDFKSLMFGTQDIKPNVQAMIRAMPALASSPNFMTAFANPGIAHFLPKDMVKPDSYIDDMLPKRAAYAAEMDQLRVVVKIYGDSTFTVGDVINLQLMTTTGDSGPRTPDRLLAGNYLINKLSSTVLPPDVRPMFTQVAELISGGFAETP